MDDAMPLEDVAPPQAAPARCRLFGAFALERGGRQVRLRSRRGRALIAYLVFAGPAGAARERLSGLLWSDRGEEQARASLRQCLLELRKALSEAGIEALQVARDQVSRDPGALTSDVDELEAAIRDRDSARLGACLRAIAGSVLLEDAAVGGLFDDWIHATRARVDHDIEREVRRIIEAAEESRAWDELRAIAEAFLLRSPADEMVAAAAIRADMAQGITASAHRRFRALESTLAAEFGLRPGSTVARALDVAAEPAPAPAAAATTRAALPAAPEDHASPIVVVAQFEGAHPESHAGISLAQTVRDEVVSGLGRFRDLHVVTDPQPASALNARAFDDPRLVFTLGARIRPGPRPGLTVQLVRLHSRSVVWSDTFDVPEAEILSAIDSIVARVVGAVLPSIDQDLVRPHRDADSGSSHLRYLKASRLARSATTYVEAKAAADELKDLIRTHPDFVLPYLPLAALYNTDFNYTAAGASDVAMREEALSLAKTAMAIDRGHVHSYTVAAWGYLRVRQWDAAEQLLERALSLNPYNAGRLMQVGFGYIFLDRREEARELLNRCLLINPAPEDDYFTDLGLLEMICGAHERAATYFELVANPYLWSTVYQAVNAVLSGKADGSSSQRACERIAAIWPREREMSEAAVIDWIRVHHPFRSQEVEARFLDGARMMLSSASAPTTPGGLALQ